MNRTIKTLFATALAGASLFAASAAAQDAPAATLGDLVRRLKEDTAEQNKAAQAREAEFRRDRDQQAGRLSAAKAELERLNAEGAAMTLRFDENQDRIDVLQDELQAKQGDFGELFGVARQVAGEVRSLIDNSIVSAQYPGRTDVLKKVAETKKLPSKEELDEIWIRLIEEMVAQRDVVSFPASVANFTKDGAKTTEVTRVGVFSVFAKDGGTQKFLEWDGSELTALPRQPASRLIDAAKSVAGGQPGRLVSGPVDPSRGTLLGLVVDAPNFQERLDAGGVIGYATLVIFAIGMVFGFFRLFVLFGTASAVRGQAKRADNPSRGNALGRILLAADEAKSLEQEAFELKLDEAILRESGNLDSGLNFIKLAAAISPLLGLLGTVTGMIITFQQITLFGTGDPKIMADGISQALVTTVIGLVSAIPLLLIHSFCSSASRSVQGIIEEQAAGIAAKHAMKR